MPISYIGAGTGTTTATFPAHVAQDVFIAFAFRDGSTTPPTVPAGWTTIASASGGGGSGSSSAIAYKVAAGSSETSGTWTNATNLVVGIYRGCDTADPIGDQQVGVGSSTTITYPAVTFQRPNFTSWVVAAAGHRSANVAIETAPSGLANRTSSSNATSEAALFDTNSPINGSGLTARSANVGGTSSNWIARSIELLAAPVRRVVLCT